MSIAKVQRGFPPNLTRAQSLKLTDSPNFLPLTQLPQVDGRATVAEACRQLAIAGGSAFLLSENDREHLVVDAQKLVDQLVAEQSIEEVRKRIDLPLDQALRLVPREVGTAVAQNALENRADIVRLKESTDTQVFLVKEGELPLGWYFSHRKLLTPATRRLVYVCANEHRNADPDHGTCYECPARIVRSELK